MSRARALETVAAWLLGLLWIQPLAYAVWTAFHPREYSAGFMLTAPLTLGNFVDAWNAAPLARYFVNTFVLVTLILAAQLVLGELGRPPQDQLLGREQGIEETADRPGSPDRAAHDPDRRHG